MSGNPGVFALHMWKEAPWRAPALAALASLIALSCARSQDPAAKVASPEPNPPPAASAAVVPLPTPALARAGGVNIADVVERVLPSVVSVSSKRATPSLPFGFGPPGSGLGSGVVVGPGLVVTNNHVVADADELKVKTADKRELPAKVLGTDPKSDLAVLEVSGDTKGLVPLELGDSSRLRLGDVVLAVGNPFGVGQTVTMGIVSAKGRANMGIVDYEDFIQTDAAINPGNSGGALVDMEGRLVGINTAILSRTGGNVGIGFAIPTNMAKPIIESLRTNGKVVRGWLGVSIQDVDQELATAMKLPAPTGVLISDVQAGGPAEKAGLLRGDVITKLEGQKVDGVGQFRNRIAESGASKQVKLELLREGKALELTAALESQPGDLRRAFAPARSDGLDGLTLGELSPDVRRSLNLPKSVTSGVHVVEVERGSPAARAGLRGGDVVLEVNREKVTGVARFREVYAKAKGRTLLLVFREGSTLFVVSRR
ncbi:MAG: Do family serine endopeptidase [Myxococcales bacterium]|nr:Do family serine endopeptidase [Myxococcales bacterium]